jgi:glycosyltransferase involved in cell wall biosynthesis
MAATNRIISYSKGLIENENEVTLLSTSVGQGLPNIYEGINYRLFGSGQLSKFSSKMSAVFAVLRIGCYLFRSSQKYNIVLIVSNSVPLILIVKFVCTVKRLPILIEKSEYPFVLNYKSKVGKLYSKLYVKYLYKLFDGMVIMTMPLMEYFRSKVSENAKLFHMPMTVEPDRFLRNENKHNELGEYIAYCGYMGGNKDGVENLLNSFRVIENEIPDVKLLLIGTAPKEDIKRLKEISKKLGLKRVIFFGKVDRENMPNLLLNAKALLLARPSSLQSYGGFPTKLGEYLSTGNPVIVTNVGEIGNYIENEVTGYLVEPDNNLLFALTVIKVLKNYNEAIKVAEQGRKLAFSVFNYKVQSKRLEKFLMANFITN